MGDEAEKKASPIMDLLAGAVKLDWIRPLLFKVGGRKLALGGAGLVVMKLVLESGSEMTWPKSIACVAVAMVAVGTSWTIASEDHDKDRTP
jgi:hypothetical protein